MKFLCVIRNSRFLCDIRKQKILFYMRKTCMLQKDIAKGKGGEVGEVNSATTRIGTHSFSLSTYGSIDHQRVGSTPISIFDTDLAYFPFKHKILLIILHIIPPIVMFLPSKTSIKKFPNGFFKPKFNFYAVKQLVTLYQQQH